MLRSRVTSGIDMVRLGNALARPGMDPRIWVSYAVLTSDVEVDNTPGGQGLFADIQLLPSGVKDTARVGSIYAGNGWGLYTPLHKDDEVLVCAPSGDPDEGLVIVQRLWSTADPQPSEIVQGADDVVLVVEPDKNLKITTKGSGNVYLTVDTGKIYLGSPDGTEPVTKGNSLKTYLDDMALKLNTHVHTVTSPGNPTSPCTAATPPITFSGPPSTILADTTEVK